MDLTFTDGHYVDIETGEIITGAAGDLNMSVVYYPGTVIHFGKHKGKTILQIGGDDPKYLKWMTATGFKLRNGSEVKMETRRVGPAVISYPSLMLTEKGIEKGIDVFARDFRAQMDNHMMDKHPEIFNSEWEDEVSGSLSDLDL